MNAAHTYPKRCYFIIFRSLVYITIITINKHTAHSLCNAKFRVWNDYGMSQINTKFIAELE